MQKAFLVQPLRFAPFPVSYITINDNHNEDGEDDDNNDHGDDCHHPRCEKGEVEHDRDMGKSLFAYGETSVGQTNPTFR